MFVVKYGNTESTQSAKKKTWLLDLHGQFYHVTLRFTKAILISRSVCMNSAQCKTWPHIPLPYPCVCFAKLRTTASTASLSTAGLVGLDRPRPRPADMSIEPNPLPIRLWSWRGGGGGGGPGEADTDICEGCAEGRVPVTPGRRDRRVPVALAPYPIPGCKRWWRSDSIVSKSDAKESDAMQTTPKSDR